MDTELAVCSTQRCKKRVAPPLPGKDILKMCQDCRASKSIRRKKSAAAAAAPTTTTPAPTLPPSVTVEPAPSINVDVRSSVNKVSEKRAASPKIPSDYSPMETETPLKSVQGPPSTRQCVIDQEQGMDFDPNVLPDPFTEAEWQVSAVHPSTLSTHVPAATPFRSAGTSSDADVQAVIDDISAGGNMAYVLVAEDSPDGVQYKAFHTHGADLNLLPFFADMVGKADTVQVLRPHNLNDRSDPLLMFLAILGRPSEFRRSAVPGVAHSFAAVEISTHGSSRRRWPQQELHESTAALACSPAVVVRASAVGVAHRNIAKAPERPGCPVKNSIIAVPRLSYLLAGSDVNLHDDCARAIYVFKESVQSRFNTEALLATIAFDSRCQFGLSEFSARARAVVQKGRVVALADRDHRGYETFTDSAASSYPRGITVALLASSSFSLLTPPSPVQTQPSPPTTRKTGSSSAAQMALTRRATGSPGLMAPALERVGGSANNDERLDIRRGLGLHAPHGAEFAGGCVGAGWAPSRGCTLDALGVARYAHFVHVGGLSGVVLGGGSWGIWVSFSKLGGIGAYPFWETWREGALHNRGRSQHPVELRLSPSRWTVGCSVFARLSVAVRTFDATKAHPALPASIAHRARAACALTLPVPRRTNGAVWGTPNGAGGEGARTDVGRWFGPSAAAGELRNLVDDFRLWATLHRTEIFAASHSPHSAASSSMTSVSSFLEPFACASESKGEQVWGSAGVTPAGGWTVSSARFLNPLVSRADAPNPSSPSLFIGVQGDGLSILPQPSPLTPLRPSMGDLSSIPRRRLHPAMDMGPPTDKPEAAACTRGGSSNPEGYVRVSPDFVCARGRSKSPAGQQLAHDGGRALRAPPRRASSTTAHDRARAPPTGGHLIPAEQTFYAGAYSAVEQSTFHCEQVGKMPLSGLDTSIADWLPRPIFTIQDEPRTWPGADDDDDMGLKRVSDPDEEERAPPPPGNEHAVCDAYTDLEGEDSFVNAAPVCKQAGLEGEGEELEPQGGRRAVAADVRTGERTEREHIVTVSLSRVTAAGVGQRVHTARGARDGGRTHSDVLKED
ncbi:hypothetical protein DFH06DRAFT_1123789 [Mycena polygramma]|nr:hypothetical protein DFH06DRAFT_1123789 [Mycena polygramma]